MRKIYLIGIIVILLFTALSCKSTSKSEKIKIGVSDWPGWVAWYIGKEKGFFDEEGVNVELVWFNTYSDSINALATGNLDANSQTLSDTIPSLAKGIPLKIILVNDNSFGNDAIVTRKDIKNISDLKGKRIAVEVGAIDHFLLLYILNKNGITDKDINIINMTTQDAAVALMQEKVDAAAIWEPWITKILNEKKGHIIASSKDTPGLVPDLLVARTESLNKKREAFVKLSKCWFKIVDFINKNPNEATSIMAKVVNVPPEEFKKMLSGIKLFGYDENIKAFSRDYSNNYSLYISGKLISEFLQKIKSIEKIPDLTNSIDSEIIQRSKTK